MDTATNHLVTTSAAARILGLSPRQVVRLDTLRPVRQLPGERGAYLYDVADVEAELARRLIAAERELQA